MKGRGHGYDGGNSRPKYHRVGLWGERCVSSAASLLQWKHTWCVIVFFCLLLLSRQQWTQRSAYTGSRATSSEYLEEKNEDDREYFRSSLYRDLLIRAGKRLELRQDSTVKGKTQGETDANKGTLLETQGSLLEDTAPLLSSVSAQEMLMSPAEMNTHRTVTPSTDLQLQNLALKDALKAYRRELVRFETEKLAYDKSKEKEMDTMVCLCFCIGLLLPCAFRSNGLTFSCRCHQKA